MKVRILPFLTTFAQLTARLKNFLRGWLLVFGPKGRLGTLLLNEGIPRALRGKKLRLKNILKFPSKSEGINTLRIRYIICVPAEGNALIF